jgi:hypothetical protein
VLPVRVNNHASFGAGVSYTASENDRHRSCALRDDAGVFCVETDPQAVDVSLVRDRQPSPR